MIKKLVLGCGETRVENAIHVDVNPFAKPDVIHDLNEFPYPFAENEFDSIQAFHVLEHLNDPFSVMRELHRVLKPGGELHLKVPHCSRGFTHTQHKAGFDVAFPLYFSKNFTKSGYFGVDFNCKFMKLSWLGNIHLLKFINIGAIQLNVLIFMNTIISFFANLNPYFCSRFWTYWVGGFDEIEFRFIKE